MVQLTGKKATLAIVDVLLFFVSLYAALSLRRLEVISYDYFQLHLPSFSVILLLFLTSLYIVGLYDVVVMRSKIKMLSYTLYAVGVSFVMGVALFYAFPSDISPKTVLVLQAGMLVALTFCFRVVYERIRVGKEKVRVLLLGHGEEYEELKRAVNTSTNLPMYFVDHVNYDLFADKPQTEMQILHELLLKNRITIIVADIRDPKLSPLLPHLYSAASQGVVLYDMRRMYQDLFRRMPLSDIGYFWFFENVSFDMRAYAAVKRVIDVVLSVVVLIVMCILHPFVWLAIKLDDGGDVFITQERLGQYGALIKLKKYRSMQFSDGGKWLEENKENKVTRVGYYLRKSRIDELPQALAVLRGDLSLIGPRTDVIDLGRRMAREIPHYMIRYAVPPGLSGWAQVNQDKQPRTVEETIERLQYDLYYVKHRSLILDAVIILKTIRTLLSRTGM
jgi:lipopolysaccharide/colanic/teichoic acid biosynthesis glycosyltransferase